jgi:hypothetical protein
MDCTAHKNSRVEFDEVKTWSLTGKFSHNFLLTQPPTFAALVFQSLQQMVGDLSSLQDLQCSSQGM